MGISAGTRLGPYEIIVPLGAGGMGEVYRARDTRLERTVAIKVLPSHLSDSPDLKQRFEREAKTTICCTSPSPTLWIYSFADGKSHLFLKANASLNHAQFSPDGRWVAYSSNESGRWEVYVTSFPAGAAKWRVSNNGITLMDVFASFDWSPDGKSLRYKLADTIYTVDVHENGDRLDFSPVKEVFTLPHDAMSIAIMPDGKRSLIARTVGNPGSTPLELVLNWRHLVQ